MKIVKRREGHSCGCYDPLSFESEERSKGPAKMKRNAPPGKSKRRKAVLSSSVNKRKVETRGVSPDFDDVDLDHLKKRVANLECRVCALENPPPVPPGYIRASDFYAMVREKRRSTVSASEGSGC